MSSPSAVRHLSLAVQQVIQQNKKVDYSPTRFAKMTANGTASDLVRVCERLLTSEKAFAEVLSAVCGYPDLLTLEEVIAHDPEPAKFGLSAVALALARERAERLHAVRSSPRKQGHLDV